MGTLDLALSFPNAETEEEKIGALSIGLVQSYKYMLDKGYLSFKNSFFYAKTQEYWQKLLEEGKIPYREISKGEIKIDLWVPGYLDKEKVDEYVDRCKKVLNDIDKSENKRSGTIGCPVCKEEIFHFNVNVGGNINGTCQSCGFYLYTIK
ncbi:MAG: hypothetical protein COS76_03430 [Candidatus Portnoybacteria bacterium CG06_land_8_20_14_3_00_39_12]|uniref:Uncharacterized protein n=1 Tax=Candidatus Portnoybacteria bacterium CG06_land_8_20_14_3_00_39_12 TaxID=1974809 RepID=A0A2M7AWD1_9BACT|nr:MAG: hypothetical protein COS76_03430 [Candidatus Portnoybacteria bacterium CG06_land_8_20_14_3_00_39_12]